MSAAPANGSRNAWLIGGLQFEPADDLLRRLGDDYETVILDAGKDVWSLCQTDDKRAIRIAAAVRHREVLMRYQGPLSLFDTVQDSVHRVLLEAGRLPMHAALVTPPMDSPGVLIIGNSGQGKSSLAWLAVTSGWRVVSDDLVALRETDRETVGVTIRSKLRIAAHLVDARTRSRGRRVRSDDGLAKIRLDPDVVRPGSFLREARIGRIAFLERAAAPSFLSLSRTEALERLMSVCSPALSQASTKAPFQLLADLVRRADAKVARLTQACLSDPRVLEELAS